MDDAMTLKSLRANDKNPDARVYVVDGKPLKSILKKPKESKTNASGSQQHLRDDYSIEDLEKAVYNKNFPCLVTNRPNSVSLVKGADGKPFQVRRKVVIAHDESNTVWEYDEIDESSSRSTRAMETETCNKPPQVVIESTKNGDSSMDNLVTHHTDPMCEFHADENQISKPSSVESDANDVNGSRPQMNTGSYASVVTDSDQVNNTTNDGCKFESKGTKRVNFRSLVSEERVDNSDTVLPMAAMEKVKNSAEYVLKHEVSMAIPLEDGTGHTREVVKVEYEWNPPHWNDCKIFGHTNTMCSKRVNLEIASNNSDKVTKIAREPVIARFACTNSYGFTKVKRKKNKGPSTSNSFDALNNEEVGADCGESSSRGIHQEESVAESCMSKCESDEDVDEFIFPEGDKFGDKLDIRLKGRVRK
ncbi:hypothetical protein Tco_0210634 [Tanacetum coccineum]